ncbi:MAG: ATP-binding cassette domain-containing protein [Helicobacter sp.]|nr:ATP-binding cassette domain-containing protein [Helicobacter sp.]
MNIIEVKNLVTNYNNIIIHDNISFSVKWGEIFGILGSSGSGKSTLIQTLITLKRPKSGQIKVLGSDLATLDRIERQKLLNQCGILFQFGALINSLTVVENIGLMLEEYSSLPKPIINEIAKIWALRVGLNERAFNLFPHQLSGGMRKRAALARAMALNPKILFLDEPTSGLDPLSSAKFDELILELKQCYDFSVIIITHDLETIKNIAHRFIVLKNGTIEFDGNLDLYIKKFGLQSRKERQWSDA